MDTIMYVTHRQRHNQAMLAPSGKDEKAIVQILRGLQDYRNLINTTYADPAGAALNQGLSDIARGLQKLMGGSLGRLDPEMLAEELAPFVTEGNLSLVPAEPQESLEAV
ncbi:MAG: hypothetical protein ACC642_01465 [Pseudomonadales bacterium]